MRSMLLTVALATLVASPAMVHGDAVGIIDPYGSGAVAEPTPETVDGYRKGKKVKIEVLPVGPDEWADVATAKAFLVMSEAALVDGLSLYVYSGFRTMEHQKWLYQGWKEGWGNKAGKPGHSNHQLGRALDIYLGDTGTYEWLEANAKTFGFKRTVPGEPWHWEYVKKPVKKKAKKAKKKRAAS